MHYMTAGVCAVLGGWLMEQIITEHSGRPPRHLHLVYIDEVQKCGAQFLKFSSH